MEQKQSLQQMVLGDLDSYVQKNETRSRTYAIHKNNNNTITILEENTGRKISDIPSSNILTDMSPKVRDIKERINIWNLIKLKSFCRAQENSMKIQREPTVWENIFASDTSDKGLISKIYKELTRLHSRKTNNPIKKWAKDLKRHFSKEDVKRAQRHMKTCSASLGVKSHVLSILCRNHI